jgi:hypothetical protein
MKPKKKTAIVSTGRSTGCAPASHDWSDQSGKCVRCGEDCTREEPGRFESVSTSYGIRQKMLKCGRCGADLGLSVREDSLMGL